MTSNTEYWEHIKYVSANEDARRLLDLLADIDLTNQVTTDYYYLLRHDIKDSTIRKLTDYQLIKTNVSMAVGYTQKYIKEQSVYSLTPYGLNFRNAIQSLAILKDTVAIISQLNNGEFSQLKHHLRTFIYSDNTQDIIQSHSFLFGTGASASTANFYARLDEKLISIRTTVHNLRSDLVRIASQQEHNESNRQFSTYIEDFITVAKEILTTLVNDEQEILEYIQYLEQHLDSDFMAQRTNQIVGDLAFNQEQVTIFTNQMKRFIQISRTTGSKDTLFKTINQLIIVFGDTRQRLSDLENYVSIKNTLLQLASSFRDLSPEEASHKFMSLTGGNPIHHVTINDNVTVASNVAHITRPELLIKEQTTRVRLTPQKRYIMQLECQLANLQTKEAELQAMVQLKEDNLQSPIQPVDVYNMIKHNLIVQQPYKLLKIIVEPASTDFVIKTKINDKIQQLTFPQKEVKLHVSDNVYATLRTVQTEISKVETLLSTATSNITN